MKRKCLKYCFFKKNRLVDTASVYRNESEIGKALKELGVRREDVFITSKLKPADQGSEKAPRAIEQSLKNLGTDYLVSVLFKRR